jgi:hypothetical protein
MSFPYYKKGIFMRRLSNRAWFSLALLFVIVPVGSLTTFRLTGTLKEPQKPETTSLEAVSWNMSRPTRTVTVNEWTRIFYTDGKASVGLGVNVVGYRENWGDWPSDGDDDIVDLRIIATANISDGFIYSMVVKFSRTDILADVVFQQTPSFMDLRNLEIRKIRDLGAYNREAYFETAAPTQPKNATLSIIAYLVFLDGNNTDHWTTVNLEATYFNGTTYRKMVMPIRLGVLAS